MSEGEHEHDHDAHTPRSDDPPPSTDWEVLERALGELLVEEGVIEPGDVHRQMDWMDSRNAMLGAQIVATAWTDPAFKVRLLADARATLLEDMDLDIGTLAELEVYENTDTLHHVVVCTLCSCYPRNILGIPPAWYKSREYRSRVVHEPRAVLAEFGTELGEPVRIRVLDSTADLRYLIIPVRPTGTDGWSAAELARLVSRDSMIGTALARDPQDLKRNVA
ncbi:MAG: nitrile hydratase subunit alpha [Alphaproteobacteria bacterium]|nr:nitrile hydratase subunit alpha [Alphaproteobacteria bacterium]